MIEQVAKELSLIKDGKAKKSLLARHAASRAAAVNLHARCQKCESCLAVGVSAAEIEQINLELEVHLSPSLQISLNPNLLIENTLLHKPWKISSAYVGLMAN